MVQTVYLSTGGPPLNFPDGMSKDDMKSIIMRDFGPQAQAQQQIRDVQNQSAPPTTSPQTQPSSFLNSAMSDIINAPTDIVGGLLQLPGQAVATGQQIAANPVSGTARALGQVGAGALQSAKDFYNLIAPIALKYSSVNMPTSQGALPSITTPLGLAQQGAQLLGKSIPSNIGNTGLQQAIFGQTQPGDVLPQEIGSLLGPGKIAKPLGLLGRAAVGATYGAATNTNPVAGALSFGLGPGTLKDVVKTPVGIVKNIQARSQIGVLKNQIPQTEENIAQSQSALATAKQNVQNIHGVSTPNALQSQIQALQNKITPASQLSSNDMASLAQNAAPIQDSDIANALQNVNQTKGDLQNYLGNNQEFSTRLSDILAPKIDTLRSGISNQYNELQKEMDSQNIPLSNPEDVKSAQNQLSSLLQNATTFRSLNPDQVESLVSQINSKSSQPTVNAGDVLTQYRSVDKLAKQARAQAYSTNPGLTPTDRQQLLNNASDLDNQAQNFRTILENGVGKDVLPRLQEANSQWAEYAQLYKNPIFRDIQNKGRIDTPNLMSKLSGEKQGNPLLRQMIFSDPDALRYTVGQTLASKPETLLNPNETQERFISQSPDLQQKILAMKNAFDDLNNTKQQQLMQQSWQKQSDLENLKNLQNNVALNKDQQAQLSQSIQNKLNEIRQNKTTIMKVGGGMVKYATHAIPYWLGYKALKKKF